MHVSRCLFVDGKLFIKGPCFIATYYLRPVCLSEMDIRNSQAQEPRMPELVLPIRSKAEHTAVGSVWRMGTLICVLVIILFIVPEFRSVWYWTRNQLSWRNDQPNSIEATWQTNYTRKMECWAQNEGDPQEKALHQAYNMVVSASPQDTFGDPL